MPEHTIGKRWDGDVGQLVWAELKCSKVKGQSKFGDIELVAPHHPRKDLRQGVRGVHLDRRAGDCGSAIEKCTGRVVLAAGYCHGRHRHGDGPF